ncbi:MAG: hypothetical protein OSB70_15670 [Myxococcota bacterium]|nr:hypothetical protein [Myxococcota bacterium]
MRNGRRGDSIDNGQFDDSLHGGLVSANAPPVADAGPNQPSVPSGATVQLPGGATDPEGDLQSGRGRNLCADSDRARWE